MTILILFSLFSIAVFIDLMGIFVLSRLLNLKLKEFTYGVGLSIYQEHLVKIKLFPIGGSIAFCSRDDKSTEDEAVVVTPSAFLEPNHNYRFFEEMNYVTKVFLAISGCIVLSILASFILGTDILTELFPWLLSIVESPFLSTEVRVGFISLSHEYILNNGLLYVFAKVCFFHAIVNLLPLPMLHGGAFIVQLVKNKKMLDTIFLIGFFYWVIIIVSWLYALIQYITIAL